MLGVSIFASGDVKLELRITESSSPSFSSSLGFNLKTDVSSTLLEIAFSTWNWAVNCFPMQVKG